MSETIVITAQPKIEKVTGGPQGIPGTPTAFELRGAGFPEGVVTAAVGTFYTDSAATNGAIRWVKASGAGNTGWRVIYGDTGWRNITALLVNGWTAGNVFIRRIGNQVTLRVEALNGSANTNNTALSLPTGFAPSNPTNGFPRALLHTASVTPTTKRTAVVGTNWQCLANVPEASVLYGEQMWPSVDVAWPATLPGSAA